jgi:hypothetical protein
LSKNPNITFDIIKKYYCKFLYWDWYSLSKNKNINLEIINNNNNYPWNLNGLSLNPNITFEYILNNMDLNWSWNELSMNNEIINENILVKNLYLPWEWKNICKHINISAEFIIKNIKNIPKWNWDSYCENIYFDFKCLNLFPDIKFNWYSISQNPNINIEIYEKYKSRLIRTELFRNKYEFHKSKIDKIHLKMIEENYKKILELFKKYINTSLSKLIISYIDNPFL